MPPRQEFIRRRGSRVGKSRNGAASTDEHSSPAITMSSPTRSSEETGLLDDSGRGVNSGGSSLNQPFIAGYASGVAAASSAAATGPPPTAAELEAARIAAVAAEVNQVKAPVEEPVTLTRTRLFVRSLVNVFAYLSAGVVIYHWLADMSFLDALYFCVVTLTTVGYGDLSAHKPMTKLVACGYILVGVALIASFLAQLVELFLDEQEDLLMRLLKKSRARAVGGSTAASDAEKAEQGQAHKPGFVFGSNDDDDDNSDRRNYVGVTMGVFYFLLLVAVGTAMFKVSGDMSVIDALYLTVVSSSTVGYGDYYPATKGTRVFAIFFLPLSTLLLGKVISDYTEMKASERTKRKQKRILLAAVNAAEYDTMDTDNNGRISLLEFMCGTLIRQERVTQEDLTEIHTRFVALDRDSSGFVTRDEIGADRDQDGDGIINPHEL